MSWLEAWSSIEGAPMEYERMLQVRPLIDLALQRGWTVAELRARISALREPHWTIQ